MSLKRSMKRAQYDKFCEVWKNEKTYQKFMKEDGKELPEGSQTLGRKPTFKMWMTAMKNQDNNPVVEEKSVEVADTSWEE